MRIALKTDTVRIYLGDKETTLILPLRQVLLSLIVDESKDKHVRLQNMWANGDNGEFTYRRVPKDELESTDGSPTEYAVARAGFRIADDLLGKPCLWCIECGRDSGFHLDNCSKAF